MRVLNLGSMNVDYVYSVPHIIIPGETLATGGRNTFAGGKGLNQSIAMEKAGLPVMQALPEMAGKCLLKLCSKTMWILP